MDAKVETFYRQILTDSVIDQEENQDLIDFFSDANPPPDKLVWLRSSAFRIGSELLSEDDKDRNVAILRAINAIIHALEKTCMV
jgi:poly(U)-specific endoribonuclease